MGVTLRHYDRHRRKLLLSELLDPPGRAFQAAVQLVLAECGEALDATLRASGLDEAPTRRLGRVTLANYAAAAVMMPYEAVLAAAQETAWDVELIGARFGASWEQVAHRLTTLGRPGARGVPFFMLRVDRAGNVSKRFSAGAFPFARLGGTCPRWAIHSAFESPGRVVAQLVDLPDGKAFLTVARTVRAWRSPSASPRRCSPWRWAARPASRPALLRAGTEGGEAGRHRRLLPALRAPRLPVAGGPGAVGSARGERGDAGALAVRGLAPPPQRHRAQNEVEHQRVDGLGQDLDAEAPRLFQHRGRPVGGDEAGRNGAEAAARARMAPVPVSPSSSWKSTSSRSGRSPASSIRRSASSALPASITATSQPRSR